MLMEAKELSIPIETIIQDLESELDSLTEKQEELCDKGQSCFHITEKIIEKRGELEAMQDFWSKRSSNIFIV